MNGGHDLLDPGGEGARIISREIVVELIVGGLVFALVVGLLVAIVIRARRRPSGGPPAPESEVGHRWIWLGGIVLPLAVLSGVLGFVSRDLWALERTSAHVRVVEVIGHRWWWEVRYPGTEVVTANELALPVGERVLVRLVSASARRRRATWPRTSTRCGERSLSSATDAREWPPMRHRRHYTLEEARAQLDWVMERLAALRGARDRLTDAGARATLGESAPGNGGGRAGRHVGEGFLDLQAGVAEFEERDIVLRDLDRGLVDFPSLRDGREIYLCWIEGERDIEFWHDLDAGFGGRQPL